MYELMVEENFSAAHQLRGYQGSCEKLHGHTFKVQVFIFGEELNKIGLLEDFKKIKTVLRKILKELDHTHLNKLPYFRKINPSAENISRFLFEKLEKHFSLSRITVWESPTAYASFQR